MIYRTAPFSMILKNPTPVSRSRHPLMLNISEYRHSFSGILIGAFAHLLNSVISNDLE